MDNGKESDLTKFEKKIIETFSAYNKKNKEITKSPDHIQKSLDALNKIGQANIEFRTKYLNNYYNGLLKDLNLLKNPVDILRHLYKEKGKFEEKLIQANIDKDGYSRKSCMESIESILNPLIQSWENKVKSEKELQIKELPNPIIIKGGKMVKRDLKQEPNEIQTKIESTPDHSSKNLKLPSGFVQFKCDATKEQITSFFSILAKENNPSNGKPYMSKKDIEELLVKNFLIFGKEPTGQYFDINLSERQKGVLRYFVYEFYFKYELEQIGTKMKYVNFLIWNFNLFKNDNPVSLNKNMNNSNQPSKGSIIPIDKYFPK